MKDPKAVALTDDQVKRRLLGRIGPINKNWPPDRNKITLIGIVEMLLDTGPSALLSDHIDAIVEMALPDDDDRVRDPDEDPADAQTHEHFGQRWWWRLDRRDETVKFLNEAVSKKQWRLAIMLAGTLSLAETLHATQLVIEATAPAKKPAPATGKIAKLKDLVEQARPLFKADPHLDREGLIAKIGRRYERLTTFAELKTLCAGKTPTTHSLKKAKAKEAAGAKDELRRMQKAVYGLQHTDNPAPEWPFATKGGQATPKPKRPRRDPAPKTDSTRPGEMPASSIPQSVRSKPWPQPIQGTKLYNEDLADHAAEFASGDVTARFTALETESGWTHGCRVDIADLRTHDDKLREDGPLAQDPDTAVRDATARALAFVKTALKDSEPPSDEARTLAPHVADLLKLRSWLLGFQARGVEKVRFLREQQGGPLELAA